MMESFVRTLKTELTHHRRYRSRAEARADVFDYIETLYNDRRRHFSLDDLGPLSSRPGPKRLNCMSTKVGQDQCVRALW